MEELIRILTEGNYSLVLEKMDSDTRSHNGAWPTFTRSTMRPNTCSTVPCSPTRWWAKERRH